MPVRPGPRPAAAGRQPPWQRRSARPAGAAALVHRHRPGAGRTAGGHRRGGTGWHPAPAHHRPAPANPAGEAIRRSAPRRPEAGYAGPAWPTGPGAPWPPPTQRGVRCRPDRPAPLGVRHRRRHAAIPACSRVRSVVRSAPTGRRSCATAARPPATGRSSRPPASAADWASAQPPANRPPRRPAQRVRRARRDGSRRPAPGRAPA